MPLGKFAMKYSLASDTTLLRHRVDGRVEPGHDVARRSRVQATFERRRTEQN